MSCVSVGYLTVKFWFFYFEKIKKIMGFDDK